MNRSLVAAGLVCLLAGSAQAETVRGIYRPQENELITTESKRLIVDGTATFKRLLSASEGTVEFEGQVAGSTIKPAKVELTGLLETGENTWVHDAERRTLLVNLEPTRPITRALMNKVIHLQAYVVWLNGDHHALVSAVYAKLKSRVLIANDERFVSWKPGTQVEVGGLFTVGPNAGKARIRRSGGTEPVPVRLERLDFGSKITRVAGRFEKVKPGYRLRGGGPRIEGLEADLADSLIGLSTELAVVLDERTNTGRVFRIMKPKRKILQGTYDAAKQFVRSGRERHFVSSALALSLRDREEGEFEAWVMNWGRWVFRRVGPSKTAKKQTVKKTDSSKGMAGKVAD